MEETRRLSGDCHSLSPFEEGPTVSHHYYEKVIWLFHHVSDMKKGSKNELTSQSLKRGISRKDIPFKSC
jgi:hypothetical protein